MEAKGSAARGPDADLARWRDRRELGGALIAAGAGSWLVHSVLMIVGLVVVFSVSLTNVDAAARSVLVSLLAFIGAIIAVLVATFLLGAGLLVYRAGTRGLSWRDWSSREARSVSNGTRAKGAAAAALVMVYGILGILVIGIYVLFLSTVSDQTPLPSALRAITLILTLWIIASIVLIAAAALLFSFLRSLRREAVSSEAFGGGGFLAYAITNGVGVFLFAGSLLMVLANPIFAPVGLVVPIIIGGVMELLAVPSVGIITFIILIVSALRLRKLQPGRGATPGAFGPRPAMPFPYAPPASPQQVLPPPVVGSAMTASAAGPSWRGVGNVPPPPPMEAAPVNPAAPFVTPPPPPPEDASWMLRLQAQMDTLEKALTSRIAELEREISETKGKLPEKPAAKTEAGTSAESLDEFDSL